MEEENRTSESEVTERTCSYCPSVATTIRQDSAVCYYHATHLQTKTGLAARILSALRSGNKPRR